MRQRGFTLVEVLVAFTLTLAIAGVAATFVAAMTRAGLEHPRNADEQQRLRGAFEFISAWIGVAGQGLEGGGANEGWLLVPPLYPQRRGVPAPDTDTGAWSDRVTIVSGVQPGVAGRIATAMASRTSTVDLDPASCGGGLVACGFDDGMRALVADSRGSGEWFTVDGLVASGFGHWPVSLAAAYGPANEAVVTAVDVRALTFDPIRRQLRVATPGSDLPMLDGVAGFTVTWLGDPRAPRGPVPAAGEANCALDAAGNARLPAMVATDGPWVVLTPAMLSDGPWCGTAPWRYDADLLRVRLLRVLLRLDPTPLPGARPQPPPVVAFDVAPRNLIRFR